VGDDPPIVTCLLTDPLSRYDPNAEGAVVMKAPTKEHVKKFNKKSVVCIAFLNQFEPILCFQGTYPSFPWF
jgi:hypothetical protein